MNLMQILQETCQNIEGQDKGRWPPKRIVFKLYNDGTILDVKYGTVSSCLCETMIHYDSYPQNTCVNTLCPVYSAWWELSVATATPRNPCCPNCYQGWTLSLMAQVRWRRWPVGDPSMSSAPSSPAPSSRSARATPCAAKPAACPAPLSRYCVQFCITPSGGVCVFQLFGSSQMIPASVHTRLSYLEHKWNVTFNSRKV